MPDRNALYAEYIRHSGDVLEALISRSGYIEEANTHFQTLFGVHCMITSVAVFADMQDWAYLLPEAEAPAKIRITAAAADEDVLVHLYPYGDHILLLGIQSDKDSLLSRTSSDFASMMFSGRQQRRHLSAEVASSREDAHTDPLTHLKNRRWLELYEEQVRQHEGPISLAMLDIDHFKQVNDRFGHGVGDEVLEAVAGKIASSIREGDIAVRYGGEEFTVVLPNCPLVNAITVFDRMRTKISATVQLPDQSPVTISIGVTERQVDETLKALQERADQALYQAKESGRNRVVGVNPGDS